MEITALTKPNFWPRFFYRGIRLNLNPWVLAAAFVLLIISTPIFVILLGLFKGSGEVWDHIASTLLTTYVTNSLLLLVGTSSLTFLFGVSTAWFVTVYQFPGRRILEWALVLPLAIPTYIVAYTYSGMLDYTGPIQTFLRNTVGANPGQLIDIMTLPGLIFVISVVLYPYVYMLTRASFIQQSATAFEAAQILGRSSWQTFLRIALPLARPAIAGGLLLVIMETLNDYGAAKYFGIHTFTTGIFRAWFSLGDADAAIRLCGFLMVFVLVLISAERLQRGKARFSDTDGHFRPQAAKSLSRPQTLAVWAICMIPLSLGFVFPVLQLLGWSWQAAASPLTSGFLSILFNSFLLATLAALLTVGVALLVVYTLRLRRTFALTSLSKVAILGYSIPGAVIAIGVMIPFARIDLSLDMLLRNHFNISSGLLLSGTLIAVTFAYVVRFLALAVNPIESGLSKSCTRFDEASRSLGVSASRTLLRINLPLIKSSVLAAVILVFVDVLKELPLTLILRPFNFDTLATRAFELASDERLIESANPALIIIFAGMIPVILINRLLLKGRLWKSSF